MKGPEKAEGSVCIRAQRLNLQERSTEGVLEKRAEFIHSSCVGGGCPVQHAPPLPGPSRPGAGERERRERERKGKRNICMQF